MKENDEIPLLPFLYGTMKIANASKHDQHWVLKKKSVYLVIHSSLCEEKTHRNKPASVERKQTSCTSNCSSSHIISIQNLK